MCTVVRVITDDDEVDCETLGELAEALGVVHHWMLLDDQNEADENECLCWVDMTKFGAKPTAVDDATHYGYVIDRRKWV